MSKPTDLERAALKREIAEEYRLLAKNLWQELMDKAAVLTQEASELEYEATVEEVGYRYHHIVVRRGDQDASKWVATCSCGWNGPWRLYKTDAAIDSDKHCDAEAAKR